jgi:DNA-binding transcriptional LysR family regulator
VSIDITDQLLQASRVPGRWSEQHLATALQRLQEAYPDIAVDWDTEAGENWASLLVDHHVVAFVHNRLPLAMHVEHAHDSVARDLERMGLIVIPSPGYDERLFRVTPEAWSVAFPDYPITEEQDLSSFSMHDLWYDTI